MRRGSLIRLTCGVGHADGVGMAVTLTAEQHNDFYEVARRAAGAQSRDDQAVGEAAGHAVVQLAEHWDGIDDRDSARRAWVRTVAVNHARRVGRKLHRELAMGRQGSVPPPMYDEVDDERVEQLIAAIHHGQESLGATVAMRVDLEGCLVLLSADARSLLDAKYVYGFSSKEIAERRGRGESPGTIDNKLTAAKKVARELIEDLVAAE